MKLEKEDFKGNYVPTDAQIMSACLLYITFKYRQTEAQTASPNHKSYHLPMQSPDNQFYSDG